MAATAGVQLESEDVQAALRSQLGSEDIAVDSWELVSLMEDGRLGNLGDHFKILGKVKHPASAAEARDFSFFVKALPQNKEALETVEKSGAFKKEALFYKLLAKEFQEILSENRGPGFQPCVFPRCHLIKGDCLLLDDLGKFKFTTVEGRKVMDIEHVRMVVRDLAVFSAASLVLEERRGRSILDLYPELGFETFFSADPSHMNTGWHNASIKLAQGIVPHLDKYKDDSDLVTRVQDALPGLLRELFPALQPWPDTRNAMVHGDAWVNNIMFRHDAEGRPLELSLVDFQLMRYTPPAHDLVMFILFCTDKAFQDRHFAELTHLFWDSMAATLRRAALDPDKVYPRSEFEAVTKKMWKFGLIEMALEHPFALASDEVMQPVLADPERFRRHCHEDRTETCVKMFYDDPFFRYRFTETMERLIDGYILNAAQRAAILPAD